MINEIRLYGEEEITQLSEIRNQKSDNRGWIQRSIWGKKWYRNLDKKHAIVMNVFYRDCSTAGRVSKWIIICVYVVIYMISAKFLQMTWPKLCLSGVAKCVVFFENFASCCELWQREKIHYMNTWVDQFSRKSVGKY